MVRIRPYWLILALAIDAHAIGFNTNAWPTYTNLRLSNAIVTNVYAAFQSITFTNYTSPTSTVIITDTFLSDIYPDQVTTNLLTNRWAYPLTRYSGTVAWTYRYTATTAVVLTPTNIALQAQDVWTWDTYLAIQERSQFVNSGGSGLTTEQKPKFYRSTQPSLVASKGWIRDNLSRFVTYTTNPIVGTNFATYTASNLLTACGLPTNYLSWTPNRGLSGTGQPYYHLTTTTWVIVSSTAGITTQSTWDACGNSVNVVGTNGQIVTSVCTNQDIAAGYTSLDYGFPGITAIVSRLVWTWDELTTAFESHDSRQISGSSLVSFDAAKVSNLSTNYGGGSYYSQRNGPIIYTSGATNSVLGYVSEIFHLTSTNPGVSGWEPLTWGGGTNGAPFDVRVEMWGHMVGLTNTGPTDYHDTDYFPTNLAVNGVTWGTNWQAIAWTNLQPSGRTLVSDFMGYATNWAWCDSPTIVTPKTRKGFVMDVIGLIRGDVTNGLRYR